MKHLKEFRIDENIYEEQNPLYQAVQNFWYIATNLGESPSEITRGLDNIKANLNLTEQEIIEKLEEVTSILHGIMK
jgi:hypothetical protein